MDIDAHALAAATLEHVSTQPATPNESVAVETSEELSFTFNATVIALLNATERSLLQSTVEAAACPTASRSNCTAQWANAGPGQPMSRRHLQSAIYNLILSKSAKYVRT